MQPQSARTVTIDLVTRPAGVKISVTPDSATIGVWHNDTEIIANLDESATRALERLLQSRTGTLNIAGTVREFVAPRLEA